MNDWYKKMFEGNLGKFSLRILDRRKEITGLQISFLRDVLNKGLVLDHCCGPGRLSIPLSAHMPIVGADLSTYLLQTAHRRAKEADTKDFRLVRADMRYLPFRSGVFDSVMNFWTSFGYFSEEENKRVLSEIAAVLKRGGLFVLDIANPMWLLRNFREKDWDQDETYLSLEERAVDWKSKRWKSRWIVVNKQTKEIDEIAFDHRLYDSHELREMLDREGLVITQTYGSFEKESFEEAVSNRIILLSKKK
jgi:ubiquinone/menaquinone biosynthesis C-methylase UbiE